MELHIELDPTYREMIDQIIKNGLKDTYDMLREPQVIPVFSGDPKKEAKQLKKFIKAFKEVHNWYCLPEDYL